jgi:hypothetical protein
MYTWFFNDVLLLVLLNDTKYNQLNNLFYYRPFIICQSLKYLDIMRILILFNPIPFPCAYCLLYNHFFDFFDFLINYNLFLLMYNFVGWPAHDLSCALSRFLFRVLLGSLPLFLVAGSCEGRIHWSPPFLADLDFHTLFISFITLLQILLT